MAEIISAVYKIINTITGDFYVGSSKDVKRRWKSHKCPSVWKRYSNNPLYKDMQKYGVDNFDFEILEEVESEQLEKAEQKFIEKMHPTSNDRNANGLNIKRYNEYQKEYKIEHYQQNRDKYKEYKIEYYQQNREKQIEHQKEYYQQNHKKRKEYQIEYYQQNREKRKEYNNKYQNQLCYYNNEILTLAALSKRFQRAGISHPAKEAKKYLVI